MGRPRLAPPPPPGASGYSTVAKRLPNLSTPWNCRCTSRLRIRSSVNCFASPPHLSGGVPSAPSAAARRPMLGHCSPATKTGTCSKPGSSVARNAEPLPTCSTTARTVRPLWAASSAAASASPLGVARTPPPGPRSPQRPRPASRAAASASFRARSRSDSSADFPRPSRALARPAATSPTARFSWPRKACPYSRPFGTW